MLSPPIPVMCSRTHPRFNRITSVYHLSGILAVRTVAFISGPNCLKLVVAVDGSHTHISFPSKSTRIFWVNWCGCMSRLPRENFLLWQIICDPESTYNKLVWVISICMVTNMSPFYFQSSWLNKVKHNCAWFIACLLLNMNMNWSIQPCIHYQKYVITFQTKNMFI